MLLLLAFARKEIKQSYIWHPQNWYYPTVYIVWVISVIVLWIRGRSNREMSVYQPWSNEYISDSGSYSMTYTSDKLGIGMILSCWHSSCQLSYARFIVQSCSQVGNGQTTAIHSGHPCIFDHYKGLVCIHTSQGVFTKINDIVNFFNPFHSSSHMPYRINMKARWLLAGLSPYWRCVVLLLRTLPNSLPYMAPSVIRVEWLLNQWSMCSITINIHMYTHFLINIITLQIVGFYIRDST